MDSGPRWTAVDFVDGGGLFRKLWCEVVELWGMFLIQKHGGYRKLKSFQVAQLVHDVTVRFVERYVDRFSRTRDQMVQAARSGGQNIAEGSQALGTSRRKELKLINVACSLLDRQIAAQSEAFFKNSGFTERLYHTRRRFHG